MKNKSKILVPILSISLLMASLPLNSFAQSTEQEKYKLKVASGEISPTTNDVSDQKLKETILKVKGIYNISDSFDKFEYNLNSDGAITTWNFNWRDSKNDENINVAYGADGNTYNYYSYISHENSERKNLGKVSKDDAMKYANDFLKLAMPSEFQNFKPIEQKGFQEYGAYYFTLQYYKNNIPVDGGMASIGINAENGKVNNYNCSFSPNIIFPSADGVIDIAKAKEAYKNNIGLKLVYNTMFTHKDNDSRIEKIYPVYVPKYSYDYSIDAKTGERILINEPYRGYGDKAMSGFSNESMKAIDSKTAYLSPSEETAINDVQGIIPKEKAAVEVLNKGIPNLNKDMKPIRSALYKSSLNTKSGYVWDLGFKTGDDKDEFGNIQVAMDAKTGEIINFNLGRNFYDSKKGEYKIEDVRKEAEIFLKSFSPEKFAQTVLDEEQPTYDFYKRDAGRFVDLNYVRIANGVQYPDNRINITFDTLEKTISGYYCNWYDVTFPDIKTVMPQNSIFEKIFDENKIELQYRISGWMNNNQKTYLIYQPKMNEEPLIFDAFTGEKLGYNGLPMDEVAKMGEYNDIDNHFAKQQLLELSRINVGFYGKEFKPNQKITQKEMAYLMSQTFTYSDVQSKPIEKLSEEEIDAIYNQLKRKSIIKEKEIQPDVELSREEAVKYIVRALGYGGIAEHSEIFVCDFKDFNDISSEYKGFVAIAKTLGLITGNDGMFNPKDIITRGEAAVILHRYLSK